MRISDWSSDVCSSDLVQDWKGGAADEHAAHDHGAMVMADHSGEAAPAVPLARIVEHARAEHMPPPATVQPPGAPNPFGPPNGDPWTLTTQPQQIGRGHD